MKKTVALLLLVSMFLSFLVIPAGAGQYVRFPDVPVSHWASAYIERMQEYDIINGYEDGYFRPSNQLKTGEFIKMLSMALGTGSIQKYNSLHWSEPFVEAFGKAVDIDSYTPAELESTISREDATVLVCKYYMVERGMVRTSCVGSYVLRFGDCDRISSGARKYIDMAVEYGIVDGFEDGEFKPENGLTRAQAAKILFIAMTAVPPFNIVSHADPKYYSLGNVFTPDGKVDTQYLYNDGAYVKLNRLPDVLTVLRMQCPTQELIGAGYMVNLFRRANGLDYGGYYMLFSPSDDCYIENGINSAGLERICEYSRKAAELLNADILCVVFGTDASGLYGKFEIVNGEVVAFHGDTSRNAKDGSNLISLAPSRIEELVRIWTNGIGNFGIGTAGYRLSGWNVDCYFTYSPDICHVLVTADGLLTLTQTEINRADFEESAASLCRTVVNELTGKYYWNGSTVVYCLDAETHVPVIVISNEDIYKYSRDK